MRFLYYIHLQADAENGQLLEINFKSVVGRLERQRQGGIEFRLGWMEGTCHVGKVNRLVKLRKIATLTDQHVCSPEDRLDAGMCEYPEVLVSSHAHCRFHDKTGDRLPVFMRIYANYPGGNCRNATRVRSL